MIAETNRKNLLIQGGKKCPWKTCAYNRGMAAATSVTTLLDLRQLRPEYLAPLIDEEAAEWSEKLDWDFRPSAELVRRFIGMQALSGHGLCVRDELAGYSYFVCEEHKGLIGDLYVRREFRSPETEARLLEATVRSMLSIPSLRRIESQLMVASHAVEGALPFPQRARHFARDYMMLALPIRPLPPAPDMAAGAHYEPWHDRYSDQASAVIAAAYEGHIDGHINDQYRSALGARRFLSNIVQYPGCGSFFQPASQAVFDRGTGALAGVCLSSLIAFDTGHITQICVDPRFRGRGYAYEMMRRALDALTAAGCRRVTLTVTTANQSAKRLYERMGFSTRRVFNAVVWEL